MDVVVEGVGQFALAQVERKSQCAFEDLGCALWLVGPEGVIAQARALRARGAAARIAPPVINTLTQPAGVPPGRPASPLHD